MRDQTLHHRDTDCQLVGSYEKLTAKLEGTRRVQTHAILLYPNPIDLWPFNPRTMSQSLLGYLKITPYAKFEHCFRFSVMLRLLVWKMHVLTQWPWTVTFQPQNHVTSRISQGQSIHQVWILRDHSFWVMLRTNRQPRISYQRWVVVGNKWNTITQNPHNESTQILTIDESDQATAQVTSILSHPTSTH